MEQNSLPVLNGHHLQKDFPGQVLQCIPMTGVAMHQELWMCSVSPGRASRCGLTCSLACMLLLLPTIAHLFCLQCPLHLLGHGKIGKSRGGPQDLWCYEIWLQDYVKQAASDNVNSSALLYWISVSSGWISSKNTNKTNKTALSCCMPIHRHLEEEWSFIVRMAWLVIIWNWLADNTQDTDCASTSTGQMDVP